MEMIERLSFWTGMALIISFCVLIGLFAFKSFANSIMNNKGMYDRIIKVSTIVFGICFLAFVISIVIALGILLAKNIF